MAYDAELTLASPLRLEGGPDKFTVANVSGATVYDVLIARRTPEGIRVAWLDELAKSVEQPAKAAAVTKGPASSSQRAAGLFGASRKPAQAPAAKSSTDNKGATGLFGVAAQPAAPACAKQPAADQDAKEKDAKEKDAKAAQDKPNAEKPDQNKPAPGLFGVAGKPPAAAPGSAHTTVAEPATKAPSASEKPLRGGVEVSLSGPLPAGSAAAADATTKALADRLAHRGLAAQEIDTFVAQYGSLLFESDDLVVACRLDAGVIDEKVALSIFPLPTKIVRVPMLVMRNADPQLPGEIARLIARNWATPTSRLARPRKNGSSSSGPWPSKR